MVGTTDSLFDGPVVALGAGDMGFWGGIFQLNIQLIHDGLKEGAKLIVRLDLFDIEIFGVALAKHSVKCLKETLRLPACHLSGSPVIKGVGDG